MKRLKMKFIIIFYIFGSLLTFSITLQDLLKKTENEPYNAKNHYVLAISYYFKGEYKKALKHFLIAVKLNPKIVNEKDYGMSEGLLKFVKKQGLNSDDKELRIMSVKFLNVYGFKRKSTVEIKKMLSSDLVSGKFKIKLKRQLNNFDFLSSI
jgi:tetratricopeptide (TPR) repeat protein